MIPTKFLLTPPRTAWSPSSRPRKTAKTNAITIPIYIAFAIWLKTPSCASKAGAVLPHATPNVPLPSSPLSKSAALSFGSLSRDYTIYQARKKNLLALIEKAMGKQAVAVAIPEEEEETGMEETDEDS